VRRTIAFFLGRFCLPSDVPVPEETGQACRSLALVSPFRVRGVSPFCLEATPRLFPIPHLILLPLQFGRGELSIFGLLLFIGTSFLEEASNMI